MHKAGADRDRRSDGADHGQAAVVLEVIEPKFRVVEARGQVVHGQTPLIKVSGLPVVGSRNGAKGLVVGEGAEPEHHLAAAPAGKIVGAEIGAVRIDFGAAEFQQPNGFQGKLVREGDGVVPGVDWQECLAQLRARRAQPRDVDRIDHIDAVGNERALAPAEDLPAKPNGQGHRAEVELAGDIVVEDHGIGPHGLLGLRRKRRVRADVIVLGVVKGIAAHKGAEIVPLELQIARRLVEH